MTKYAKDIKDIAEALRSTDRPMSDILKDVELISASIENISDKKTYTLPYSSNPKPLGERWRTA